MSNKPKTASEGELEELHAELARTLKKGLSIRDDNGAPIAAIMNVARQFLKDNKVEAKPVPGTPLGELADLPVFDDDIPQDASYQ